MDREAVQLLLRRNPEISIDRECVEYLSSRQRGQKKISMDRPAVENLARVKQKDRQKRMCRGICREAIEQEEKEFLKGGKTHKDECNKQATQSKIHSAC